MTVQLESMGVKVPGHVVRKRDGDDTVLILNREQAASLYHSLNTVLGLFESIPAE